MRQLTDEEAKTLFIKLSNYLGENTQLLLENKENPIVFRILHEKVYMIPVSLLKFAQNFGNSELRNFGTLMGKFSKTKKFRLNITSLSILNKYALRKVWLKQNGESHFIYGNHALKAHVARMSEGIKQNDGVIVYNINDIPLGFGVLSKSPESLNDLMPTAIVVINQSDIGEYLRIERNPDEKREDPDDED